MRRVLVLAALAACGNPSSPQKQEGSATQVVVPTPPPAVPDAPPEPALAHGVDLLVSAAKCATLDDCAALRGTTKLGEAGLQQCDVATTVQLRNHPAEEQCDVVLQHGGDVFSVPVDLVCADKRLQLARTECGGKTLAVELAVTDGDTKQTVRLTCQQQGASLACARDAVTMPGGPVLATFLGEVKAAAEKHQWKALLALCSPEHRKQQTELGISQAQYIAELFGLHAEGNSLVGDEETIRTEHLTRITELDVRDVAPAGGVLHAVGYVRLDGGTRLRLFMMIEKVGDRYVLTGAAG